MTSQANNLKAENGARNEGLGTSVASQAFGRGVVMNMMRKLSVVAVGVVASFLASSPAYAVSSLTINVNVTVTAVIAITWYGNAGDAANSTVHGNAGASTTLVADQTADVSWNLANTTEGAAAVSTAGADPDAALQFVVKNVGNTRMDFTARAVANASVLGTTWTAGAAAASNVFKLDASTNGGTNWDNLTGAYADPDVGTSRWDDKAVSSLTTIELRFAPPTAIDNGGEAQVIKVGIQAASG